MKNSDRVKNNNKKTQITTTIVSSICFKIPETAFSVRYENEGKNLFTVHAC